MIEIGNRYSSRVRVDDSLTAAAMGSGDLPVFATPAMIALMENAALMAVAPHLREGETTVGGFIECSHIKPSAVGCEITAVATLRKIVGAALHFDIAAYCDDKLIGEGHHIRYVVDRQKFLDKLRK